MGAYKIIVLPGDGIGPEVMGQAMTILNCLQELFNNDFDLVERPCGFSYYEETGNPWPDGTFALCRGSAHAILLGAIGRSKNKLPLQIGEVSPGKEIVLGLRSKLDLYANVRPVKLFNNISHNISGKFQQIWLPQNIDMTIIRENTEGFYYSPSNNNNKKSIKNKDVKWNSNINVIQDVRHITKEGSKRIIEFAFKLARDGYGAPKDLKKRVTCVDKSNVLNGCRLFRKQFHKIALKYTDIEPDYAYIDAFTQSILQNPEYFDVIVTTNLFGDIITDLAAVLQGGLGMAPSANIGNQYAMFEPVHGSAPDIAGKNIANPIGMILSTQMMLEWLAKKFNDSNLKRSSDNLVLAVENYLKNGRNLPQDLGGSGSTNQITKEIIKQLKML